MATLTASKSRHPEGLPALPAPPEVLRLAQPQLQEGSHGGQHAALPLPPRTSSGASEAASCPLEAPGPCTQRVIVPTPGAGAGATWLSRPCGHRGTFSPHLAGAPKPGPPPADVSTACRSRSPSSASAGDSRSWRLRGAARGKRRPAEGQATTHLGTLPRSGSGSPQS